MQLGLAVSNALRVVGEPLTLRQIADGSFNTTTQIRTPGAVTNTEFTGLVHLVDSGIDGVTVKRGDLTVWASKVDLDNENVTPVIGNLVLRGTQILTILDVDTQAVAGYYKMNARGAE